MAISSHIAFALLLFSFISLQHTPTLANKKSYIVYLNAHKHGLQPTNHDAEIATQSHYDLLGSVLGSYENAKESVEYSYNKYINGFAAKLTDDEVARLKKSSNVVYVNENRELKLQTTRSWEFLGLEQNGVASNDSLWNSAKYGDGVIIATIDSGVWPESESFNDQGLGPIPSKWKGTCDKGTDKTFKCNKKLIGARFFRNGNENSFNKSQLSPRDNKGHGTHTLSTLGGSFVKNANVFGFGSGVAKGGLPKARVAAYKVCWTNDEGVDGCMTSDIVAAFEAAISDGVDVLSLSIGSSPIDLRADDLAVASFHAIQHGISVVASAGNDGPVTGTVSNVAPWIFTVGASTLDREFSNRIHLGNSSIRFKGASMSPERMHPKRQYRPLILAAAASSNSSHSSDSCYCQEGSLDSSKVKGKIVVCERGQSNRVTKGQVVKSAGGVGMILINDEPNGNDLLADPHFLPASHISYKDGLALLNYIKNTPNPTGYISNGKTELGIKPSPMIASFSSRGPSKLYPNILKPDVTAPGVSIIAAFTSEVGPSSLAYDTRRVKYNVMSGTSMSCPHVSGIVGLLKSLHPDWSPAAIRSALMTTATTFDNVKKPMSDYNGQQATPFGYGAGHINPNAAANPGLIYDLSETDYLEYLCSIFTEFELIIFTSNPYKCKKSMTIQDFNYPSITVANFSTSATVSRTVTNVGGYGRYVANVTAPNGVNVKVSPSTLKFDRIGEKQSFKVELKVFGNKVKKSEYVFGSLVWSDGKHNVRSPIVVERV